jgi:IS4 transposase
MAMIFSKSIDRFADRSPMSVMIRGSLEYALGDDFINQLFEETATRQYTRSLLFSDVVDLMSGVVCQVYPSVGAGFQKESHRFTVSRQAFYDKLNCMELNVSRELVRQTARRLEPVVRRLQRQAGIPSLLPGYRVRILDGNHLSASEHRIEELRDIAAGPLPGHALVVLDPDTRLILDVFPCEDAHASERRLLTDVLDSQDKKEVWIGDRNFCTSLFLLQTDANDAYFIVRQHKTNVRWEPVGELRSVGRTDSGMVYQQRVQISDAFGSTLFARRITIRLDKPTEDGDTEIHILTNLPKRVSAKAIAGAYRGRWRLEGAFGELATCLNCEISSLGYPPAALFAFCVGLVAYNILSLIRTSLAAAHGPECVDEISAYYVADEIRGMTRGLEVAVSDRDWKRAFGTLTPTQMANTMLRLAKRVRLECFKKHRRGPKKPTPKRTKYKEKTHVSTARILAESRGTCLA